MEVAALFTFGQVHSETCFIPVCPLGFRCLNGGTRREATCSCDCADGWRAKDCSGTCLSILPEAPRITYPPNGKAKLTVLSQKSLTTTPFGTVRGHTGTAPSSSWKKTFSLALKVSVEMGACKLSVQIYLCPSLGQVPGSRTIYVK